MSVFGPQHLLYIGIALGWYLFTASMQYANPNPKTNFDIEKNKSII